MLNFRDRSFKDTIHCARALRGHFLVEIALTSIILETLIADKKVDVVPLQPIYVHAIKGGGGGGE